MMSFTGYPLAAHRHRRAVLRWLGSLAIGLLSVAVHGQFEHTRINVTCPCSLDSSDGNSAQLQFAVSNNTDEPVTGLYATVAIAGTRTTTAGTTSNHTAFVDTVPLNLSLDAQSTSDPANYEIDLGVIPAGQFYFELLLHENEVVGGHPRLDSVWFKGEWATPVRSLQLVEANYLIDSDADGVDDINEENQGTDPSDPNSFPPPPVIDVLFLHEELSFEHYNATPESFIAHIITVTNDIFTRSESPVRFRAVAVLDTTVVPEIIDGESLEQDRYLELLGEYAADLVLVFRTREFGLCGFAVSIGGFGDRGFLHPHERFPYTEVFLDPSICSIDTTAHEIGHLMGLGHTLEQGSVGTYVWSRGHALHGEFGTVMAYAESFFRAVGLDVFSNPRRDCHGKPCGIAHTEPNHEGSADSTQSLNILKYQFAETNSPDPDFDFDNDGVGAVADAFPIDPEESSDQDGDGFGDNRDVFPNDPLEWTDTDGDGIGDNSDPDIDDDGILNLADPNPFESSVTQPRLVSITSDSRSDEFGFDSVRIHDFDNDERDDIAVAAPSAFGESGTHTGRIYLFSLADFVAQSVPESPTPGSKRLQDLVDEPDTWVIHGPDSDSYLGTQLDFAPNAGGEPELLLVSYEALYLVNLDARQLAAFDELDSEKDRQIDLTHCDSHEGCLRLWQQADFDFKSVRAIGDLDGDNRSELAIVGQWLGNNHAVQVFLLNRASLDETILEISASVPTFQDVFANDNRSFRLDTPRTNVFGELSVHGDITNLGELSLLLGVFDSDSSQPGLVYVINATQLQNLVDYDLDGDRIVAIDDLIAFDGTIKVSNPNDPYFGLSVNSLADIVHNEVATDGMMVWGSYGNNYLFTDGGLRLHDLQDEARDGSIVINQTSHTEYQTWLLNGLGIRGFPGSTTVLQPPSDSAPNLLLNDQFGSVLSAELGDLEFLDDPTNTDLNSIVNLPVRIRYPGIYELRVPIGPNGFTPLNGYVSLGDLDGDAKTDFAFSMHSAELRGRFSTMYVVHSSELEALDRADGREDHVVMLHNNAADTDGDGIPNIHDPDDDNDGLEDFYDEYPLLREFQYDADGDWYANANDVYPLDFTEHSDIDFDGIGDRDDPDIDGDGIINIEDKYPYDTDNDGLANVDDPDDDNDGVLDEDDAFPIDPNETADTDGDGVGDNRDAFAADPTEWIDTDADGIGNNADPDDDNDGYLDEDDAFPLLASEWLDSDGDGVGDNTDQFPHDPLEWEDADGDGYGDNHGSSKFASYRLQTPWFQSSLVNFNAVIPESFRLGDFNLDGTDDIEIANALTYQTGKPLVFLSGADLNVLDELDSTVDRTIDLSQAHQGGMSWRVIDSNISTPEIHFSGSNVGDVNSDGVLDILIVNPFANDLTGSITILYGGGWPDIDAADGVHDHEIDLVTCVANDGCANIRSTSEGHGFGFYATLIGDYLSSGEVGMTIGTISSESRRLGQAGLGMGFVIPHGSVTEASKNDDGSYHLSTLTDSLGWTFYPEFDPFLPGLELNLVGRIPDIDRDGTDDFVIHRLVSTTARIYFIGSSDVEAMDGADFTNDRKVNLINARRQPSSYRLDGFQVSPNAFLGSNLHESLNGEKSAYWLPIIDAEFPNRTTLIDLRALETHDRADGTADGIVEMLDSDGNAAWEFRQTGNLLLCKPESSEGRIRGVFSPTTSANEPWHLKLFDARNLAELDVDATGIIDLAAANAAGVSDTWVVSFGPLMSSDPISPTFSCAGDLDGDNSEDVAITFSESANDMSRTQVILLMSSDLERLDQLDGTQDLQVDVSLLWPRG